MRRIYKSPDSRNESRTDKNGRSLQADRGRGSFDINGSNPVMVCVPSSEVCAVNPASAVLPGNHVVDKIQAASDGDINLERRKSDTRI